MVRSFRVSLQAKLLAELTAGTLPGMAAWREYHRTGQMPSELTDLLFEGGQP